MIPRQIYDTMKQEDQFTIHTEYAENTQESDSFSATAVKEEPVSVRYLENLAAETPESQQALIVPDALHTEEWRSLNSRLGYCNVKKEEQSYEETGSTTAVKYEETDLLVNAKSEFEDCIEENSSEDISDDSYPIPCITGSIKRESKEGILTRETGSQDVGNGVEIKKEVQQEARGSRSRITKSKQTYKRKSVYVCGVCNKTFTQLCVLKNHQRTHTGEKPYLCTTCGKSFAQLNTLNNHQRIHTGIKPYSCTICSKCFTQMSNLTVHQRMHTGIKPYVCDMCAKAFASSGELAAHQPMHTGSRPFTCNICGKSFALLKCLVRHKRVHTGEKPYVCNFCGKRFSQSCHLGRHTQIHTRDSTSC